VNKKAFTLIEILIVIVVIGILSALVIQEYAKIKEKTIAQEAVQIMNKVMTEIRQEGLTRGSFTRVLLDDLLNSYVHPLVEHPTQYWKFSGGVVYVPPSLYIKAFRIDFPYQEGSYIELRWNCRDDTLIWSGCHPGTPGGPTFSEPDS